MPLNSEQFEELSDLLVQHFDDEGKDLDRVVKYNLGSGLFVDYAAHDKFRNVVEQLLTKTEQKGSTVKLFEGVLRVLPDPDGRAIIARILPQATLAAPETVKQVAAAAQGVKAIRARLGIAAVHALVATLRNDLERLASDLDLLARYKALHDCLHTLQIQFLRQIDSAARKLETDPSSASEALLEYLSQLQTKSVDAQEAAQGLPDTPGERDEQMGWVLKLAAIIDGLRAAVEEVDGHAAVASVYKLKFILRQQPSRLGELIVITARRTPITHLVETLQRVAEASVGEDGQARDLTNGIAALQRFIPDQMGLVAQHSEWQKIADFLWQADELLHQGSDELLEGFQFVWQDLASMVREITSSDPAADWAIALNRYAAAFERAFPMPPSAAVSDQARLCFGMFMNEANKRFYWVDKALHAQCDEIIKLGQPLRGLLEEIPDDGH
jgi:hypothetical protein